MGTSSLTKDQSWALCIGSVGSQPLDHQGTPPLLSYQHRHMNLLPSNLLHSHPWHRWTTVQLDILLWTVQFLLYFMFEDFLVWGFLVIVVVWLLQIVLQWPSSDRSHYVCVSAKSLQLFPTLCHPVDFSPPGSSAYRILQARTLEWVAVPSSRGPSCPRDWTNISHISYLGRQGLYHLSHLGNPGLDSKDVKPVSLKVSLYICASISLACIPRRRILIARLPSRNTVPVTCLVVSEGANALLL